MDIIVFIAMLVLFGIAKVSYFEGKLPGWICAVIFIVIIIVCIYLASQNPNLLS